MTQISSLLLVSSKIKGLQLLKSAVLPSVKVSIIKYIFPLSYWLLFENILIIPFVFILDLIQHRLKIFSPVYILMIDSSLLDVYSILQRILFG